MGKVLFIACTPIARCMMEEIKNNPALSSIEICGIVNLDPKIAVNKANYDPYVDLILKYGFPHYYCNNINEYDCLEFVRQCDPDIIIQSGWSQKFKPEIMSIPKFGCIGEHPAPLPKGRGAACVNWAIIDGEKDWGDTFFKMEDQYDIGYIYAQKTFTIEHYDDVKTVYDKVAQSSALIVRENIIDWTKGSFLPVIQDESKATYYKRRTPADGVFDFTENALTIYNKIRGQARPYPGAFFIWKNKKITVWKAAFDFQESSSISNSMSKNPDGSLDVVCGDGYIIKLIRLQSENQPEIWGNEWEEIL